MRCYRDTKLSALELYFEENETRYVYPRFIYLLTNSQRLYYLSGDSKVDLQPL